MSRKVDKITPIESYEEKAIAAELNELEEFLENYSVKYPDENTLIRSVEQLRFYVPHKKPIRQKLSARLIELFYRVFPIYRFTGISLFFFGSLLLPNKLY